MSAMLVDGVALSPETTSSIGPVKIPSETGDRPVVRSIPAKRRRAVPAPFRSLTPTTPLRDEGRTISPTRERRNHMQELVEETITLVDPIACSNYNVATRENVVVEVLPGLYSRAHRIRSPLDTLDRSRDIGEAEVRAGRRYAREFESANRGMRGASIEVGRGGTGGVPEGISETQVKHISSIRRVRAALGACAEIRLRLLLVEELSFSAMAKRLAPDRKDANRELRAQAVLLLEQLAEHYRSRAT